MVTTITKHRRPGGKKSGKIWHSNSDIFNEGYFSYSKGTIALGVVGTDLIFNAFKLGMGEFNKGAVSNNLRNFHDVMAD